MIKLTPHIESVLKECKLSLEREVKQTELSVEEMLWDIKVGRDRLEYCRKAIKDIEEMLKQPNIWTNDGEL